MKKYISALILLFAICSFSSFADEASHKKAAEKLLEVTNTKGMIEQMTSSINKMLDAQFESVSKESAEAKESVEAAKKELNAFWLENISWAKMQPFYVDLYVDVFSEKELDELIVFYQSPLGKKVLLKMPELMQKSMLKTQTLLQEKMPEFQKRLQKKMEEIQNKYKSQKSSTEVLKPLSPSAEPEK